MPLQADPVDYVIVDENEAHQYAGQLPETANGFVSEQYLPHDKFNKIAHGAGAWHRFLDQNSTPLRVLVGGASARLSSTHFGYPVSAGLGPKAVEPGRYLIFGRYVELSAERLAASGFDSYTFKPEKDHHFYVTGGGDLAVSIVAVGTPPAPAVDQEWICTMTADASDVTAIVNGDSVFAPQRFPINVPMHFQGASLYIDKTDASAGSLSFINDSDPEGPAYRLDYTADERLQVVEFNGTFDEVVMDFGTNFLDAELFRDLTIWGSLAVENDAGANITGNLQLNAQVYGATSVRIDGTPSGGELTRFRSTAAADATDATMYTHLFRIEGTATSGAQSKTIFTSSQLTNTAHVAMSARALFSRAGNVDINTYQVWEVIFKKVGGVVTEQDGGAAGEHLSQRAGLGGSVASSVSWSGTGGAIQVTFTMANAGRYVISGILQVSRYD